MGSVSLFTAFYNDASGLEIHVAIGLKTFPGRQGLASLMLISRWSSAVDPTMAMSLTERLQIEHLLRLGFVESDQPTAGNMAVF